MKILKLLTAGVVAAGWVAACGGATAGSGSNSNWLERCTTASDCRGSLECRCGVCTTACETANDCAALAKGATCVLGSTIDASCAEGNKTSCALVHWHPPPEHEPPLDAGVTSLPPCQNPSLLLGPDGKATEFVMCASDATPPPTSSATGGAGGRSGDAGAPNGGAGGTVDHCVGSCAPGDQCHVADTTCEPSTGICSSPSLPNGTACDDGDPNTVSDACTGGTCGGAYVNDCPSSGDGGLPGCHRAFALVGAHWSGTVEPVDAVSLSTGLGTQQGVLGDLHWWSDQLVQTGDGARVAAIGRTTEDATHTNLYVLDLASGFTNSVAVAYDYTLAGVLPSGSVVGAYLAGSSLQVDVIDPVSGVAVTAGAIENIYAWPTQIVLDAARNRVYAFADPDVSTTRLYALDLSSGSSSSQPLAWDGFIGGVTADGQIVATGNKVTDPSTWFVALIEPATAAVTWKGKMGDMYGSSSLVYDSTTHVAHATGSNRSGVYYLYSFDLARNVSTQVLSQGYVFAKQ